VPAAAVGCDLVPHAAILGGFAVGGFLTYENAFTIDEFAELRLIDDAIPGAGPMVGPFLFLGPPDAQAHAAMAAYGDAQFLDAYLSAHDRENRRFAGEFFPLVFCAILQAPIGDAPFAREEFKIPRAFAGDDPFAAGLITHVHLYASLHATRVQSIYQSRSQLLPPSRDII
jgi:hypothetical protein